MLIYQRVGEHVENIRKMGKSEIFMDEMIFFVGESLEKMKNHGGFYMRFEDKELEGLLILEATKCVVHGFGSLW